MFKVSVMYPNQEGARFDIEYYRTKHMDLVIRHLKPFGLVRTEVLKGISGGGGQPAPYVCIGSLYFETADGYEKGWRQAAGPCGRHPQLHQSNAGPPDQRSPGFIRSGLRPAGPQPASYISPVGAASSRDGIMPALDM